MIRLIEADGPDAVGVYYGDPSGFSSSNIAFMNGWLDAVGTHSRYFVGSVDRTPGTWWPRRCTARSS